MCIGYQDMNAKAASKLEVLVDQPESIVLMHWRTTLRFNSFWKFEVFCCSKRCRAPLVLFDERRELSRMNSIESHCQYFYVWLSPSAERIFPVSAFPCKHLQLTKQPLVSILTLRVALQMGKSTVFSGIFLTNELNKGTTACMEPCVLSCYLT